MLIVVVYSSNCFEHRSPVDGCIVFGSVEQQSILLQKDMNKTTPTSQTYPFHINITTSHLILHPSSSPVDYCVLLILFVTVSGGLSKVRMSSDHIHFSHDPSVPPIYPTPLP